jgi:hypothetical protein
LHFDDLSIILGVYFLKSPKTKLMNISKLVIGGITGGVAFFLLGWLIYGNLLMNFMASHPGTATGFNRSENDMDFLYLIIGNLAMGFLLAFIFIKGNVSGMAGGLATGFVVGLLMSVGIDCVTYGTTHILSKTGMAADVAAATAMWAIAGALVGLIMGMGKKAA